MRTPKLHASTILKGCAMQDLLYLGLSAVLFALSFALIALFEKLRGRP